MPKVTTPVLNNPPDTVIDISHHPVETQLNDESNNSMWTYIYIYIYIQSIFINSLICPIIIIIIIIKSEIRWKFQM